MKIKYTIRTISPTTTPCYLQPGQYGLSFSYRTHFPYQIHYFDSHDDAIEWIERHACSQYVEIVEVYVPD